MRHAAEPLAAFASGLVFPPDAVVRARFVANHDTPLRSVAATGQTPPGRTILDHVLRAPARGRVTLRITDPRGQLVREYTSDAAAPDPSMPNVPMYWFAPPDADRLPVSTGAHRVVWDLRYPTPPSLDYGADGEPATSVSYGIIATAIAGQSPRRQPVGPLAVPGRYQAALTVDGQTLTGTIDVRPDPRVTVTPADFDASLGWQLSLVAG